MPGLDRRRYDLIREDLPADAAPLLDGRADAAILIEPADADVIQKLLRVKNIRLMDFSAEAEAYDNRWSSRPAKKNPDAHTAGPVASC